MNRTFVKKISAMLSLMLIIAIMVPVLAFASISVGLSNLTYKDGTVSGSVYTDVYVHDVEDAVYVNGFYNDALVTPTPITATYSKHEDGGYYYYDFSSVIANAYSPLKLQASIYDDGTKVIDSVYSTVYNSITPPPSSRHHGGSGGGAVISSDGSVTVSSDGSVDANTLKNALTAGDVTLNLVGDLALLPASALEGNDNRTITLINDNGTYVLPVSVLILEELAKALGIDVSDMIIRVSMAKLTGTAADDVKAAATALGGTQLADAVDFSVTAVGPDGKTTEVHFGTTYVSRSINVSGDVDASKTTGVLYDATTKKFSFVPSTFATADGETTATLKRNGNSIYTVVSMNKSFADLASHWSKADVELLANKLVVEGSTDTTFEPERNITRAEFAALVVRSLGLTPAATASNFTDVSSSDWYASVVATAANAGIINGYEDNTFRPDAQINREELAAMVIRALSYADVATNVTDPDSVLSKFTDADDIVWAQKEIASAIGLGIINGMTADTIGSADQATRAQAATMLKRYLGVANFID